MKKYSFIFFSLFFFLFLSLPLLGCQKETHLILAGKEYLFHGNTITQLSTDEDTDAKYGVFSDIHGEIPVLGLLAEEMKRRGVEGLIVLGDIPLNDQLRSGKKEEREDRQEIRDALFILGKTGLPVFVIPGNHERKTDYEAALNEVTAFYPNVIDMVHYRLFEGDDINFVSLPGYQIKEAPGRKFIPDDGYFAQTDFIRDTGKISENLNGTRVLLTHGPPKTDASLGPGTIDDGRDVGDETTRKMMQEHGIAFALSGHIHEAGGLAATLDGKFVRQKVWSESFVLNVGSLETWKLLNGTVSRGMAAIVIFDGEKAKYEMVMSNFSD